MNEHDVIQEILSLSEDQIKNWAEDRISKLENENNNSWLKELHINNQNLKSNFIPHSKIIRRDDYDIIPFRIDDTELYIKLITSIREADSDLINNNNYIIHLIQCTIINYFGLHGIDESRSALCKKADNTLSIKDFKQNLTAMSTERSCVAHNLLKFLGFNDILNYGCTYTSNSTDKQLCTFNCIINAGRALIVDFTHPSYLDGQYYIPACYGIGEEQLRGFLCGELQLDVNHKDYYTKEGELQEYKTPMKYESNPLAKLDETTEIAPEGIITENIQEESNNNTETGIALVPKTKWYQKIIDFFRRIFKKRGKKEQMLLSD